MDQKRPVSAQPSGASIGLSPLGKALLARSSPRPSVTVTVATPVATPKSKGAQDPYKSAITWEDIVMWNAKWFAQEPIPEHYGTIDPRSLIDAKRASMKAIQEPGSVSSTEPPKSLLTPTFWTTLTRPVAEWKSVHELIQGIHELGIAIVGLDLVPKDVTKGKGVSNMTIMVGNEYESVIRCALDDTWECQTIVNAPHSSKGIAHLIRKSDDQCRQFKTLPDAGLWALLEDRLVTAQNSGLWNQLSQNYTMLHILDRLPNRYGKILKVLFRVLIDCQEMMPHLSSQTLDKLNKSPLHAKSLFTKSVKMGERHLSPALITLDAESKAVPRVTSTNQLKRFVPKPHVDNDDDESDVTTATTASSNADEKTSTVAPSKTNPVVTTPGRRTVAQAPGVTVQTAPPVSEPPYEDDDYENDAADPTDPEHADTVGPLS